MRLIVNAVPLLSPRSGVANYIFHNFRALLGLDGENEYAFHYGYGWSPRLRETPSGLYGGTRKVVRRMGAVYPFYRRALDGLFRLEQRFGKFDLYHETNYIPMPFDGPVVVTVFDLSFHLHPETHPSDRVRFMERYFYPRLGRADRFITISEAIKREMSAHLGIPDEKISVTPLGVDERYRPLPEEEKGKTLAGYGLRPGKYVLYVGTLEPRKNIGTLLAAYGALPPALRRDHPLVLAGGEGWLMEGLDRQIEKMGMGSHVLKPGYVPFSDLPALYGGAALFVFPSLYEGFGLPPLEAMACGTPVVASDAASLPEVLGGAAALVPPRDERGFAREMESLLSTPARRRTFSERGLERARRFTWEACARKTLEVYRRAASAR